MLYNLLERFLGQESQTTDDLSKKNIASPVTEKPITFLCITLRGMDEAQIAAV